ncbi:MAG: peptidylprolyl isomerase [Deltaproteobacteria bacterium]|nr:peptidylprolyl isomerase [Deltaproteobacteria bacterium]
MKLVLLALLLLAILSGCTKESKPQDDSAAVAKTAPAAASSGTPEPAVAPSAATAAGFPSGASAIQPAGVADLSVDASGLSKAVVVVKTTRGTVKFRLYAKDAPNTVKRFVELVQQKFYNGLTFHRVVPGFIAQVGDHNCKSKSDATSCNGGTGQKLKAEFNSRRHVRGTVAMARTSDPDSADSQFYFTMSVFPHLDNTYTVIGQMSDFGEKTDGKDVLDRLHQGDDIVDMHIE